jgi:hypothetical protein
MEYAPNGGAHSRNSQCHPSPASAASLSGLIARLLYRHLKNKCKCKLQSYLSQNTKLSNHRGHGADANYRIKPYKSDLHFELDLRLNLAARLTFRRDDRFCEALHIDTGNENGVSIQERLRMDSDL